MDDKDKMSLIAKLLDEHKRFYPHHSYLCELCKEAEAAIAAPAIPTVSGLSEPFKLSLAATEAYDPQSFIDGAKWQAAYGIATPAIPTVDRNADDQRLLLRRAAARFRDFGEADWAAALDGLVAQPAAQGVALEGFLKSPEGKEAIASWRKRNVTPATVKTAEKK